MKRVRYILEAVTLWTAVQLARVTPRPALRRLGAWFGEVGYRLDRRHRGIALDNLRGAFDDRYSDAELNAIVRRCWRNFGRIVMDTLAFPRFSRSSIGPIVQIEGLDHLHAAYAKGLGVLLFSAHFGHWELAALMQGYLERPLALVARPLDNPLLERLLARMRGQSGNVIVHKRNAVREILKALRRGIGVAILIDQDALTEGVFVPFFGRLASTTPTLALMAVRTGASVVPVHAIPQPDGTYRVVYEPEIEVTTSGDRDADVRALTARCTAIVERWVREHPDMWLWMHRRWKTPPPEE